MTEKINLFINDRSGKVHVMAKASVSYAICGAHSQGKHSIHKLTPIVEATSEFVPKDWCSQCIKYVAMEAISGSKHHQFMLDCALNKTPKKYKREETVIDSVRMELTFDDEELAIKVIAGESTGPIGDFAIKAEMEFTLDWDKLDEIRDLTAETEGVKLTIFKVKNPDEV